MDDPIQNLQQQIDELTKIVNNHKHRVYDRTPALDSSVAFAGTLDTDGTLAANSDTKIASQKATKTYADTKIPKNTGTTKGDIIGYTSASTPARIPIGTDGYVLTADSAQGVGSIFKALPAGITPQQVNFSKTFSTGTGSAPYTQTVTISFLPLVVVGVCEGGSAAGSTTGQSSFFVGSTSTAGFSVQSRGNNAGSRGAFNTACIGFATDAGGEGVFTIGNFTSTTFDIILTRSAGNNSGGTVAGIVYGY